MLSHFRKNLQLRFLNPSSTASSYRTLTNMYEFTTPYNCCWKLPKDWKPCSCNFQAFDVIFNHGSSKLVFCRLEFENFSCGHSQVNVLNVRARKTRLMHSHQSFIQDSLRYTAQHCATKLQHSLPHCSFLMLLLNKLKRCFANAVKWRGGY